MTAISNRTASVAVEYDGKLGRETKMFSDAYAARRFYVSKVSKDKANQHPSIRKAEDSMSKKTKTNKTNQPAPATPIEEAVKSTTTVAEAVAVAKQVEAAPTLAQALPPDTAPAETTASTKPRLVPTGDPTKTTVEQVEPTAKTKATTKAKKATKSLKRKQRQGNLLWVHEGTKTIVGIEWSRPTNGGLYDRWLIKYDDGTEERTGVLSIVGARDNPDHHLKVYEQAHRDGLTNKQFELVLQKSAEYAASVAKHYSQSLQSFKSSDTVQKEMETEPTKKQQKQEPLTTEEAALAKQLAELANKLEVSPTLMLKLPKKQTELGHNPERLDVSQYGLDEGLLSIKVVQEAVRIFRGLEPRLPSSSKTIAAAEKRTELKTTKATKTPTGPGGKYAVVGHPVTAVLRWLGKLGLVYVQAKAVLTKAGVSPSDSTIRIQLGKGKSGEQAPANLTAEQEKELRALIGDLTPVQPTKKASNKAKKAVKKTTKAKPTKKSKAKK